MNLPHMVQIIFRKPSVNNECHQGRIANGLAVRTGVRAGDASAAGAAVGSPGVLSGNLAQVPVHVPVNVCGNAANVVGLLNPAFGNTCVNA